MKKKKVRLNYTKLILCIIALSLLITSLSILINSTIKQISGKQKEKVTSEITLVGDETIYLYKNQAYVEPGFEAKDSKENDLTSKVKVENNIDITKSGEYEVKYSSSDDNTIKTRKVIVKEASLLSDGKKSNNTLAVLMYHYFYDDSTGEKAKNSNWMPISKFKEQLNYLKENNFYYPTWQEVADFADGKIDLPKNSIVITMDDGHKSVYDLAIPLLDEYKIPATAFIITKNFDTTNLEKYKNSTIDFQSHTNNMHRGGGTIGHGGIFPALSLEEGVADLKESIEKLGGNSGALAYPYGDCTERTIKAAEQAGFKVAFTTVNKKITSGMNKYELPRVRMYTEITLNGFKNSI